MKNKDLKSSLKYLASMSNDDFIIPSDNGPIVLENKVENLKVKSNKKDKIQRLMDETDDILTGVSKSGDYDFFDMYFEDVFENEEDAELKKSLVNMGKKYSRVKSKAEETEISKAFNEQQTMLFSMMDEIVKDKDAVQKDIDLLKSVRSRNVKAISELLEVKSQYHNLHLQTLKELNSVKKSELDFNIKESKLKKESEEQGAQSSYALQQLFKIGPDSLMASVGGRAGSSGAIIDDSETIDPYNISSIEDNDDIVYEKYFKNREETESDKFLKYENSGAHYVLTITEDDEYHITAEDKDGNELPDYPLPTNVSELEFNIGRGTGKATDQYSRTYEVREYTLND